MTRTAIASLVLVLVGGCREAGESRPAGGSRGAGATTRAPARDAPTSKSGRGEPAARRGDPETGRMVGMTAAHDRVRAGLDIAPLEWSPELARFAQEWADKLRRGGCDLRHRPGSGPDRQKYGENIFSATGQPADPAMVVNEWAAEVSSYDAKRDRCRGVCGHYTQIVWRATTRVGCGMATCGDTEVWVCNYDPPGNYLGQRPY